jgi:predicted DNA-binding transcriptional regulator AlpA
MPDGAGPRYAYPPRRMRVDEAARYVALSETAFRALALPTVRIGGTVGWLRDDLDAWLDRQAGRAAPSRAASEWDAVL